MCIFIYLYVQCLCILSSVAPVLLNAYCVGKKKTNKNKKRQLDIFSPDRVLVFLRRRLFAAVTSEFPHGGIIKFLSS